MISATLHRRASLLLLGAVRGLSSEGLQVTSSLGAFAPEAVGLSLSHEELGSLVEYFGDVAAEPLVPLSTAEINEVRGLARFGEVAVPNPSVVEAIGWARRNGVPAVPIDPSDEGSATLFTENIGYLELVRRTVRENRLGRSPPRPSSADDFALAWDRTVGQGRGSRRFAAARDAHAAEEARRLEQGRSRVAVVVDRERFDALRTLLDRSA